MEQQATAQIVSSLLNKKDTKSLGNLLIFLHQRWLEEQHYELFTDYIKYVKNVLRKYSPKRTKFIGLTQTPTPENDIELSLTIRLLGNANDTKITVSNTTLKWCVC